MIRRLKYKLFKWLLRDMCNKSECNRCAMRRTKHCKIFDVRLQAMRAWRIKYDR